MRFSPFHWIQSCEELKPHDNQDGNDRESRVLDERE